MIASLFGKVIFTKKRVMKQQVIIRVHYKTIIFLKSKFKTFWNELRF